MKPASGALDTLLTTKVLYDIADLYKFVLLDGTTLKWTTYDTDLLTYVKGVPLERTGLRLERGCKVGSMTITIGCGDGGLLVNGVRAPLAALQGAFDGAKVEVDRLYMGSPGDTSAGVLKWFYGYVSEVEPASTELRLTVKSSLERLNALQFPKRLFQAACPYALFDARCSLSKVTYQENVTCNGGLTAGAVALTVAGDAAHAADYWKWGSVRVTSGAAAGMVRQLIASAGHVLTLAVPLPVAIANADTLQLLPGCDKLLTTCTAKFANQNNFGGFPFVPRPESVR